MPISKPTLLLGATEKQDRYAYLAILSLRNKGHEVVAVGKHPGKVGDVSFNTEIPNDFNPHTVTLYLNPQNQKGYYSSLLSIKPQRIIFNPGAENTELYQLAEEAGIECLNACTLVMLNTQQY